MEKLTDKEKQMIQNIAENDYTPLNGGRPDEVSDTNCWVDCLDSGPNNINKASISGIMASLVKKEFVLTDGESCVLTEAGLNVYYESFPV